MIEFPVKRLCEVFRNLEEQIGILKAEPNQTAQLTDDFKWKMGEEHLSWLAGDSDKLGLTQFVKGTAGDLQDHLMNGKPMSPVVLATKIEMLVQMLVYDLERRKFAYIPPPRDRYFKAKNLLGQAAHERFPEIDKDAQDVANCIAGELYTAAVFHLMRIAECGLRAIAREVAATPIRNKIKVPIEEADWEGVIIAIRAKLDAARKLPKTSKLRRSKLAFYSDATDHCTYMKDIWRNNVSHLQKPYISRDAQAALSRVTEFMTFLATNLKPAK